MPPARLPAVLMRGGTSKGVFFDTRDLPAEPALRDRLLLRVMGSPDAYGKQIDGLGGATSSTSKVVLVSPSGRAGCDVDYWFGQVAIDRPLIDWSGNCGNLSAAVGPFALASGMVAHAPAEGTALVRIWQANLGRQIRAHVPVRDGQVLEEGDFALDGVAFAAAEIRLDFLDPAPDGDGPADAAGLFPTGGVLDTLQVSGLGPVQATCISAGNPCVLVEAQALGLAGTEGQQQVNARPELLARAEAIRAAGAVAMGLVRAGEDAAATRPGTPKLILLAPPAPYTASDGRVVAAGSVHLLARAFSMGVLHHAVPGTCAIAIGAAAAVPGTLAHRLARAVRDLADGAAPAPACAGPAAAAGPLLIGHPSGRLAVEAACEPRAGGWVVTRVSLSRSARRLMEGWVRVPAHLFGASG
jgi:2-methylaconitate isomerase